jgi:3-hydroxyacyl-CoA dehydrogenase/enoyl-CoA hydratase/3-hydroxybutyryl-CoA epimerase
MDQFHYKKDDSNVVTITMDMEGPVNLMNAEFAPLLAKTMEKLESEEYLTGVILGSAKKTFFAGGDLRWLSSIEAGDEQQFFEGIESMKAIMRRLERLPVPVVAAINGTALGGGFEICLCCNHRIAWNDRSVKLGQPEVALGLLPGAGGVVRMTHLLGLEAAMPYLVEGRQVSSEEALAAGLIDGTVDHLDKLHKRARSWINEIQHEPDAAKQPWDRVGYKIPGGSSNSARIAPRIGVASAMLFKKTRGLLPAPECILDVMVEAGRMDFDAALRIESRKFAGLITRAETKNLINAFFFDMNKVKGGANRPKEFSVSKVKKLGIIGAGMMGQAIAFVAAVAGIKVVLKDVSLEAAKDGKRYSKRLCEKRVEKRQMTTEESASALTLILPTADVEDLEGCDLIIEAVFERIDLKEQVLIETEGMLAEGGIWASNTSTLPITRLSAKAKKPTNVLGLHFFSPVEKMPLIEIIVGQETSKETLARGFDFARQIKKTPIVVNDSVGFFTSRTIGTKIDEANQMVAEGLDPVRIESMGRAVGFPVGMLALHDEVSLSLSLDIYDNQIKMGLRKEAADQTPEGRSLLRAMVTQHNRPGRKAGKGFYDYAENEKSLWAGLERWRKEEHFIPDQDIKDRMLFRAVIESLKCLEEGVLRSVADGNIGSILGIGAPAWTGGYIQFVNTYGREQFIDRCRELQIEYGERFAPPAILQEKKLLA